MMVRSFQLARRIQSKQLDAVVGALVEGLVLQLAHVGDEGDLILAVFRGHVVRDAVSTILVVGGLGSGAADDPGGDHSEDQHESKDLLQ